MHAIHAATLTCTIRCTLTTRWCFVLVYACFSPCATYDSWQRWVGVWFLSYVNGLGTYLLRYSEVKSAHPLSLDLFWLLDLSTSWLILVSDSDAYSYYTVCILSAYSYYTVCLLFTSFVFLTQSSTTLTRLVDVRSVYTWFAIYIPCLFDSFLSARLTDHWSFVSLSTLLTLSTWLSHLVLLVESTLSLLDLFVTCHYPSPWLARRLVCLTFLSAWLTTSMTRSVYDPLCLLWLILSTWPFLLDLLVYSTCSSITIVSLSSSVSIRLTCLSAFCLLDSLALTCSSA